VHGCYASPRTNTDEKILCNFRQCKGNILPLETLYRVVLEQMLF
jgi:hypothetical protein